MAEQKLTPQQLKRLEELKKLSLKEQELLLLREKELGLAKKKYQLSRKETAELKRKEIARLKSSKVDDSFKNVIAINEVEAQSTVTTSGGGGGSVDEYQASLTSLGIYAPAEEISIEDVRDIIEKREIIAAVKIIDFDLHYEIEKIPRPEHDKIYSLSTIEKNIIDVPVWAANIDTDIFEETHVLKNFVRQVGGMYHFSVSGAVGTTFELMVYNATNRTYYNWNETRLDNDKKRIDVSGGDDYTPSFSGSFKHGSNFFQGEISDVGREIIPIFLPAVSKETVYRIGFVKGNKKRYVTTDYGNLPTFDRKETPTYKLTQLPNTTTTIKIEKSSQLAEGSGELIINHAPGSRLNSSNATGGRYDIELTVSPRNQIELRDDILNGIVSFEHLDFDQDATEVLGINLTASVSEGKAGLIKGTITLGRASLRASVISLRAADIFTTNKSKT